MIITYEMALTMLMDSKFTNIFWTHAVLTTVQIQKRVMLKNKNDKNPYELWKGSIINRTIQVGRSVSGRVLLGGATPDGKIPLPLMTKGERFIRCKGKCLEREHRGMFPRGVIFTR
jgi:hypothetical protein